MRPGAGRGYLLAIALAIALAPAVPKTVRSAGSPLPAVTVSGRVVSGASRQPVRGAVVSLVAPGTRMGVVTGADGGFQFTGGFTGAWRLTATKSGYFEGSFGRRRPGAEDERVELADGPSLTHVEILMWAEAMISGAVIDETGDPVAGVRVQAVPSSAELNVSAQSFGMTDATGRYTISKLKPGTYLVGTTLFYVFDFDVTLPGFAGPGQVSVSGALVPPFVMTGSRRQVYTGTLFQDAESASSASIISLASGEERTNVDLRLPLRSSVRVSGRLTNPAAASPGPTLAVLWNDTVRLVAPVGTDGRFSLGSVPPGSYAADIATGGSSRRGSSSVVVGSQDLANVALTIPRDATVSGIIQASSPLPELLVVLTTLGNTSTFSAQAVAGQFTIAGVPPGRYVLRLRGGMSWTTESVSFAGQDVSDTTLDVDGDLQGLVVHATNQSCEVSGKVRLVDGSTAHGAAVVIFPSDPGQWSAVTSSMAIHFQRLRPNNGDYDIPVLPAGDYFIAAVDDALLEDWPQRSLLSTLSATAERLRLERGAKLVRNLVVRER